MRNINKVILIGNVARPPGVRTTGGGQKMTTFVLATNRNWHDPHGKKQSQAEFHNMLAWGKISDICQRFLQKSTLVYIEGYLKTRSWEDESGKRLYRTEIVVQDILVLDKGIRHEEDSHIPLAKDLDFSLDEQHQEHEKLPSEIEKSFQSKLSEGNQTMTDSNISSNTSVFSSEASVSLDQPLFEEES